MSFLFLKDILWNRSQQFHYDNLNRLDAKHIRRSLRTILPSLATGEKYGMREKIGYRNDSRLKRLSMENKAKLQSGFELLCPQRHPLWPGARPDHGLPRLPAVVRWPRQVKRTIFLELPTCQGKKVDGPYWWQIWNNRLNWIGSCMNIML